MLKKIHLVFLVFFLSGLLFFGSTFFSPGFAENRFTSPVDFVETARILITNERGASILVSENGGRSWEKIGTVLSPAQKINEQGFTASKWVNNNEVAAVAVNAIHLKVRHNAKADKGMVFSVLPREFSKTPDEYNSYYSPTAAILTDIPAGQSIFGGKYSPFVGNEFLLTGEASPRSEKLSLQIGDKYLIIVKQPTKYPRQIVFENRFGGKITLIDDQGQQQIIGQVLRPVLGVGRFPGTRYAAVGRLRANHAAVIDVSTSRLGKIGGFQIIPAQHGMDDEMLSARTKTQWMVVGPPAVVDAAIEGVAPLFKYFIRPFYLNNSWSDEKWEANLLSQFLVEVKIKPGAGKTKWSAMPRIEVVADQPLPESADQALKNVEQIRILFPVVSKK